jgi:predicted dehydrogenase
MAAHTHRFYDYSRAIAERIRVGDIGTPVLIRCAMLGGWIWNDWRSWVLDPRLSGGHALHNGTHVLDLVTWWMGDEPVAVYGQGSKQTSGQLAIWDYLSLRVEFANGGVAVCEMSRGNRPRTANLRDIFVQGTRGSVSLGWTDEQPLAVLEETVQPLPGNGQVGFNREIAAFVDAARNGAAPAVTGADGARAVALAVAAEMSLATGRRVTLDEVMGRAAA